MSILCGMRRIGIIAIPVVTAAALLLAGCGGYTQQTVSPLPKTVSGTTTAAPTTTAATTTAAAETTAAAAVGDPAAGKTVFASSGCVACHTLADAGSTGAVGPNLDQTKPSAALVRERVANGLGAMPSYASQLSATQVDDVVEYVSAVAGK